MLLVLSQGVCTARTCAPAASGVGGGGKSNWQVLDQPPSWKRARRRAYKGEASVATEEAAAAAAAAAAVTVVVVVVVDGSGRLGRGFQ